MKGERRWGNSQTEPANVDYKDREAWNQSMELVEDVYRFTKVFPPEELYGLSSQLRRSAVSIPSNLAEGSARRSRKELANFLGIALGSAAELETQLLISARLGYGGANDTLLQLNRVRSLLFGLRNRQLSDA